MTGIYRPWPEFNRYTWSVLNRRRHVRRRRKRERVAIEREPLTVPSAPNEVWSMDFVSDALADGRRIKILTVVDDYTKEAVELAVDHGISGLYVTRVLERASRFRGLPRAIRTDEGPEFTGKALDQWAVQNDVDDQWFTSLARARILIAAWRRDYNEARSHSAIGYVTTAEFAARHRVNSPDDGQTEQRSQE